MKKQLSFYPIAGILVISMLAFYFALSFFSDKRYLALAADCYGIFVILLLSAFTKKLNKVQRNVFPGTLLIKYPIMEASCPTAMAMIECDVHFCGTVTKLEKFILMKAEFLESVQIGDIIPADVQTK